MTVNTNVSGVEIGVWGRSHKLAHALPGSIVTAGSEILAAPVRLAGKVSGKPIEWKLGGLISAHQSTCCLTPTLGFADSYWDDEQFAGGELSGDPLKSLPLGAFRAEFMGRNFGVPSEFLVYERPPQWTFDQALAFSMLHDVRVRPCGVSALEKMSPIWNAMTRFDVGNAEWHPYWEARSPATAQPESVKVSLYLHPGEKGASSRTLLVVSNLSADQPVTAAVAADFSRMGVTGRIAEDALSAEVLKCSDGPLTVPLQPMRMRLIWVE